MVFCPSCLLVGGPDHTQAGCPVLEGNTTNCSRTRHNRSLKGWFKIPCECWLALLLNWTQTSVRTSIGYLLGRAFLLARSRTQPTKVQWRLSLRSAVKLNPAGVTQTTSFCTKDVRNLKWHARLCNCEKRIARVSRASPVASSPISAGVVPFSRPYPLTRQRRKGKEIGGFETALSQSRLSDYEEGGQESRLTARVKNIR